MRASCSSKAALSASNGPLVILRLAWVSVSFRLPVSMSRLAEVTARGGEGKGKKGEDIYLSICSCFSGNYQFLKNKNMEINELEAYSCGKVCDLGYKFKGAR